MVRSSSRAWLLVGAVSFSAAACGPDGPDRPPIDFDSGPRDAGNRDAGDAGDAGSDDAGPDTDAGAIPVDCVWGTAMPLFETAHLMGTQVPFDAAANVDGVVASATTLLETDYPAYSRVSAFMNESGTASSPQALSPSAMLMMTDIAMTTSGSGFVALYNDSAIAAGPLEIFARTIGNFGAPGAGPTNITGTMAGESKPSVARTSAGLVGAWNEAGSGVRTAILDTNGAIVGTSQSASGLGVAANYKVFAIDGSPFLAYVDGTQFVRTASIAGNGGVAALGTVSANAGNSVYDIVGGPGGAGLVYELVSGADTLIQFRAVTTAGTSSTAERTLVGIGEEGFSPSIATLAGGYFVVFRFRPTTGADKLRMVVLSSAGLTLGTRDLVDPFPTGVRHAIRIAPDGDIYVVYNDLPVARTWDTDNVMAATVRALRVVCQ